MTTERMARTAAGKELMQAARLFQPERPAIVAMLGSIAADNRRLAAWSMVDMAAAKCRKVYGYIHNPDWRDVCATIAKAESN